MAKVRVSKKNFYIYLQRHFAGKYVATNIEENEILAVGGTFVEVHKKLEEKKIDFAKVVFWGPIEEYGRTYVYLLSLQDKTD